MKDIRYCTATDCPFDECESHYSRMKKVKDKKNKVKVANLYSCCRKYIAWAIFMLEDEDD